MELTSVPFSTTSAVRFLRLASIAQASPTGPAPMTTTSCSIRPLSYFQALGQRPARSRGPQTGRHFPRDPDCIAEDLRRLGDVRISQHAEVVRSLEVRRGR